MFSYYGAKTKIVDKYPKPITNKIVEPFAGSARYSLRYFENDIILYETYEKVYKVWEYLIQATEKDILSLPDLNLGDDIRNFKQLADVEKWLIGYQLQRGNARPGCIVNKRCNWNKDKIRISKEVYKVKHWKIINDDGMKHDWKDATYFVDPPYSIQKHCYNYGIVDYEKLSNKIKNSKCFSIVCGNSDDKWLPFVPLVEMYGTSKKRVECIYVYNNLN